MRITQVSCSYIVKVFHSVKQLLHHKSFSVRKSVFSQICLGEDIPYVPPYQELEIKGPIYSSYTEALCCVHSVPLSVTLTSSALKNVQV